MKHIKDPLVAEWVISMQAESLSVRTIEERTRVVTKCARESHVDTPSALTRSDIIAWLANVPSGPSRYTYYLSLAAWFHWLTITDQITINPMPKIKPPKTPKWRPRPCTTMQIARVLEAKHCYQATRHRITFAALAGLRVSELARLRTRDFDFTAGTLRVLSKGGRSDVIPVHPALLSIARTYPATGWWWPNRIHHGEPVRSSSISVSIRNAFLRCGYDVTAHQLRHYFASTLLAQGVDSRVIQRLMRHQTIQTTARYMGVSDELGVQALQHLPSVLTSQATTDQPPTVETTMPSHVTEPTGSRKLSVYIDATIQDRARSAYWVDGYPRGLSWSKWIEETIDQRTKAIEGEHNNAAPFAPTPPGQLPHGPARSDL